MEKISAVYKIVNTITGDCYVGSSRNVMNRWSNHKCPSNIYKYPNSLLYQDMQKYGVDKFRFQILAPVMPEHLKQVEQEFIEMLKPSYNQKNARGRNVELQKECKKNYNQSNKGKETRRKNKNKYYSQLCVYNGETLTLGALVARFRRVGIKHPDIEAKKYILGE